MNIISLAAILCIVIPVGYLTWALVDGGRATRRNIEVNLGLRKKHDSALATPDAFRQLADRMMPKGYGAWLDRKLAGAGRPKEWPLERVVIVKPLLALAGAAVGIVLFLGEPSGLRFLILLALTGVFYFVPDILLNNTAQKRRASMKMSLPNMLDQMLVAVEAGLGFEGAMTRAAQNSTGPLAEEFVRTLQDIQVGRSRQDAYLALAERADLSELGSFVRAVVQADQYGIAIAKVLKAQARDQRMKRRQRAEEHAMKIPVKILFPLIFFILPAMFVILLGPAVMNIVSTFARM